MSGIEVVIPRQMQAPRLPIVIITGSAVEDTKLLQEMELFDGLKVLQKPFSLDQFSATVRAALASPYQRRA